MPAPSVPVDPAALADDPVAAVARWHATLPSPTAPADRAAIEALARRAATHRGEARTRLLQRLQDWMAAPRRSASGTAADRSAAPQPGSPSAALQALSALVDRLGRAGPTATSAAPAAPIAPAAPSPAAEAAPGPAARRQPAGTARTDGASRPMAARGRPSPASAASATAARGIAAATGLDASPAPLKAMAAFSGTWSRLRAEQRLRQALAQVPAQAGPLNSSQLVYRTLQELHALSPAYLDAFMAHIDTLLALEQASGLADPSPRTVARADTERRAGARRPRKP